MAFIIKNKILSKVQTLKKCFDGSLEEMLSNIVIFTRLKSKSHNIVTADGLKTIFFTDWNHLIAVINHSCKYCGLQILIL